MGSGVVMTYEHSISLVCVDWNNYLTGCTCTEVTIKMFPFQALMSSAEGKMLKVLNTTAGKKQTEYKNKLVNELVS